MKKMNNKVTIVTSLQNMEREKYDGRKWDDYLTWFRKTLQVNAPMVVFVDETMVDFVVSAREDKQTKIETQNLEDIPYYFVKDKIQSILDDDSYSSKMPDSHRIECQSSLYNCIQYSKFKWMLKAAEDNPFCSDHFVWMDAGLSRFFDDLDLSKPYPGPMGLDILEKNKDSAIIQCFAMPYKDLFSAKILTEEYFWDNRSYIMGGMFAGNMNAIKKLDALTEEILINKMIGSNVVNNEQIALGFLLKNPNTADTFRVFVNQYPMKNHRNYELINALGS
tara:strand:+ start:1330 stop:2163 length:834 start_codon:yes stop_codon:yes gene_type:complete